MQAALDDDQDIRIGSGSGDSRSERAEQNYLVYRRRPLSRNDGGSAQCLQAVCPIQVYSSG